MLHWRKKRCCDVVLLWQRLQKMGWLLLGFQNTVRRIVVNIPSNKISLWCHWFDSFPGRMEHHYQCEIKRVLKKLIRNSTILIRTGTFGLGRGWGDDPLARKSYTMAKCVSVEIGRLNYKKNKRICNSHLYWNIYFKTPLTRCPLLTSLLNLVKIRNLLIIYLYNYRSIINLSAFARKLSKLGAAAPPPPRRPVRLCI